MFQRILLAVDGSGSGEVAASFVGGLAGRTGAAVRVVHVNELLVGGRGFAQMTDREATIVVEQAIGTLHLLGLPASGEVRIASPFGIAASIVASAEDWGADAIVLGSRRRRRRLIDRFGHRGMRDAVTALTALPTVTAPAPLATGRHHLVPELATSATLLSSPPTPIG